MEELSSTPLRPPSRGRQIWRNVRSFVFIFVVLAALRSAIADWNDVPTGSMMPTILEGDRIFVNKLAYDLKIPFTTEHLATWANPQRGDVVVFYSPEKDHDRLVKRVIGIPGDSIELRANRLYVNGVAASYQPTPPVTPEELGPFGKFPHSFATETEPGSEHPHAVMDTPVIVSAPRWYGPVVVPPGKYFMLGDDRDNSRDSRFIGFVDRNEIVGRAVAVIASLDLNHHWLPRWDRFFTALH